MTLPLKITEIIISVSARSWFQSFLRLNRKDLTGGVRPQYFLRGYGEPSKIPQPTENAVLPIGEFPYPGF